MIRYNEEILFLRQKPASWQEIAETINTKYGTAFSGNAVRKRYGRMRDKSRGVLTVAENEGNLKLVPHNILPGIWVGDAMIDLSPASPLEHVQNSPGLGKLTDDFLDKLFLGKTEERENVLVIGDIHLPFSHKLYLDFCQRMRDKYKCGAVVFIGDVFEHHALGFWPHDPSGQSAGDELSHAVEMAKKWYWAFPDAKICIGNHDERYFRQAFKAGIPTNYLKSYNEVFHCPEGWQWAYTHQIGEVLYTHGTGYTGQNAAARVAIESMSSVVIGHTHSWGGVQWVGTPGKSIFGLNAGCGVDISTYPMQYAAHMRRIPVLGCGVVIDNGKNAYFERMI